MSTGVVTGVAPDTTYRCLLGSRSLSRLPWTALFQEEENDEAMVLILACETTNYCYVQFESFYQTVGKKFLSVLLP